MGIDLKSSIVVGVAVFVLACSYMWWISYVFQRNFRRLATWMENELKKEPSQLSRFRHYQKEANVRWRPQLVSRTRVAACGFAGLGLIAGLLCYNTLGLFLERLHPLPVIIVVSVLLGGASALLFYIVESSRCCVLKSTSASDPKVWLGVLLPSVGKGGKFELVLGSLNPYPFNKDAWLVKALGWLANERKANVTILSGEPKLENLPEDERQNLKDFLENLDNCGLSDRVFILPRRQELQFLVTDNVVRLERDHESWVKRRKRSEKGPNSPIQNHIHMFDILLRYTFRRRFRWLLSSAVPVKERTFYKELVGKVTQRDGRK